MARYLGKVGRGILIWPLLLNLPTGDSESDSEGALADEIGVGVDDRVSPGRVSPVLE